MNSLERMLGVLSRLQVAQAKELASELGVSQPTVSRLIQEAGERVCRMGQTRATRYARTRSLPHLGTRLPLHRISEAGRLERLGEMHLLEGGRHWFTLEQGRSWLHMPEGTGHLFEGLPPFIVDMCPRGYIGEAFSNHCPEPGLPSSVWEWKDDHHLTTLAHHGADCVGNLILGEDSLNQWLAHPPEPIDRGAYPKLARRSDKERPGSFAGGQQPKFLTFSGGRHVLVKFALGKKGEVARRWRDLLICENLTLEVIREAGIEAATASWFEKGGCCFLEVERFDRVGERGRRGLIPLWALSEGRLRLAPAYDMLPMWFAPTTTDVIDQPYKPDPPTLRTLDIWPDAAHHAYRFWTRVIEHEALSDGLRATARQCRNELEALRERLPL